MTQCALASQSKRAFVGWGAGIEDFDNDGLPDLFYTTGMVYPEAESRTGRRSTHRTCCFAIWEEAGSKSFSIWQGLR